MDCFKVSYTSILVVLLTALAFILKWRKTKHLLEETLSNQSNVKPNMLLDSMEQYILDNLSTVTVESLSTFIGISERSLYRFLNENYQLKSGDLIRNIRQARIKQLVARDPDVLQEEIAKQVGYSVTHIARFLEKERK